MHYSSRSLVGCTELIRLKTALDWNQENQNLDINTRLSPDIKNDWGWYLFKRRSAGLFFLFFLDTKHKFNTNNMIWLWKCIRSSEWISIRRVTSSPEVITLLESNWYSSMDQFVTFAVQSAQCFRRRSFLSTDGLDVLSTCCAGVCYIMVVSWNSLCAG